MLPIPILRGYPFVTPIFSESNENFIDRILSHPASLPVQNNALNQRRRFEHCDVAIKLKHQKLHGATAHNYRAEAYMHWPHVIGDYERRFLTDQMP